MKKEQVLIVGLGEVGFPMFQLLQETGRFDVHGVDVDEEKMQAAGEMSHEVSKEPDVMHICIPCTNRDRFVSIVEDYNRRFSPRLIINNSTVPPGTTMQIFKQCKCLVAHSPVRGVHKNSEYMKWELKRWTKYIGGADGESAQAAKNHFDKAGMKAKILKSCNETELAKLFETTYRAWMIACFQEMHRISGRFNADFYEVVDFIEDTHRVRFDRPIMFPGVISGHCLIPNIELLLSEYNSKFLRLIIESNDKRKEEIKNQSTQREAEKVRQRVIKLQKEFEKKRI
jgi:UDP-N-acetyl-D-mannosaminuronate dehydrogenase